MSWEFVGGWITGFAMAGIFGLILRNLRAERAKGGADKRPQTISLHTSQTPKEVTKSSRSARWRAGCWKFILVVAIVKGIYISIKIAQALH